MAKDRLVIPGIPSDAARAIIERLRAAEERLALLERKGGRPGVVTSDTAAKVGELLNIEGPSGSTLTVILPESTPALRNGRVTLAFRNNNPVRVVAVQGTVNGAAFVLNDRPGTYDAVADGLGGWAVQVGVSDAGSGAGGGGGSVETDLAGLSVLGRAASTDGAMAAITATAARQTLRVNDAGTALEWGHPVEIRDDGSDLGDVYAIDFAGATTVDVTDGVATIGPLVGPTGATGADGADGADGAQGAQGPQGSAGATGSTGATGPTGQFGGAISIPMTFDSTTTDSDPGQGKVRLDNSVQSSASTMRVDVLDVNGVIISSALNLMGLSTSTVKGYVRLVSTGSAGNVLVWPVSAVTNASGYYNIGLGTVVEAAPDSTPFDDGDPIILCFSPNGDKGATGSTGATGDDGPQGPQGAQGPQGVQGATGATGATGSDADLEWSEREETGAGPFSPLTRPSEEQHVMLTNGGSVTVNGMTAGDYRGQLAVTSCQSTTATYVDNSNSVNASDRFAITRDADIICGDDDFLLWACLDDAAGATDAPRWCLLNRTLPFANTADNVEGDKFAHDGSEWVVTQSVRKSRRICEWWEDFECVNSTSSTGPHHFGSTVWITTALSTGGSVAFLTGEGGHPGICRISTDGGDNSVYCMHRGGPNADSAWIIGSDIKELNVIARLNTGGNTGAFFIGFSEAVQSLAITGTTNSHIMGFLHDPDNDSSIHCITRESDGVATDTDSGTLPGTGWHRYTIRQTTLGTVEFLIDGSVVATHTTQVPDVEAMNLGITLVARAAGVRSLDVDYVDFTSQTLSR
jgi:hypothetical protein